MAGVVQYGEIVLSIIFSHEPRHGTIEAMLRTARASFGTRAFVGQVYHFRVISKLLSEEAFESVYLIDVRTWHKQTMSLSPLA